MNNPNFKFEKRLWKSGYQFVAGVDEVGRGCFAGPVVAGCVVFDDGLLIHRCISSGIRIDDSKKLSALQRERASRWIKKNSLAWGVGLASVAEINRLGMVKATNSAFRRAIKRVKEKLDSRVDYLLIDAFYIPYVRGLKVGIKNGIKERKNPKVLKNGSRQLAIINGDEKSFSIASASIIAKVYRDKLMKKIGLQSNYKKYGWAENKGYATEHHQTALLKFGLTKYHRTSFVNTFIMKHAGLAGDDGNKQEV